MPFVDQFKHLGSIIHHSLSGLLDIQERILAVSKPVSAMRVSLLCCGQLPLKVRANVSFILGILCYGLENWTLTQQLVGKLVSFHSRCLRDVVWG